MDNLFLSKCRYELVIHVKICFIEISVVLSEISAKVEDIQTANFLLISLAIFHAGFLTWKPKNIFSNNVSYIDIFNQFLYTFAHLEVCPDPSI